MTIAEQKNTRLIVLKNYCSDRASDFKWCESMHDRNDGGGKTVLVVEDFEDSRLMLRKLLEMSGYHVIEAANGREAVESARLEAPDLILMDLSLPEMDGFSATRYIRKLENASDVPIIAVSALDADEFHEAAREAGCNEYVTKPLDYDRLDNLLGHFCPAV